MLGIRLVSKQSFMENNSIPQLPNQHRSASYNAWIKVGYELFAKEGPDGVQIERMARILDLNKSGFYHYFGNHDTFFDRLMDYHRQQVDKLEEKVKNINHLELEGIQMLEEAALPILVQKQLQHAKHLPVFALTFIEVNRKIDAAFLPLWARFIEIPGNPSLALRYLEFVRDIIYARLTPASLNVEFILEVCMEAREICQGFIHAHQGETMARQSA